MTSALFDIIKHEIEASGPLSLDRYMQLALLHPQYGYYQKSDPLGGSGDFITAPEISQMFGELIGLWCVDCWVKMGAPSQFILCEMGPGRGTLLKDALRSAKLVPEFLDAAEIHLIEQSAHLKKVQKSTLKDYSVQWHDTLDDLPADRPLLIFGNEFLDALPIRQFTSTPSKWHERKITVTSNELSYCDTEIEDDNLQTMPLKNPPPKEGTVFEYSAEAHSVIRYLAARLSNTNGYALFIDYGPGDDSTGDSFQAVRNHKYADPLKSPGQSDLTAHVSFDQLGKLAQTLNCDITPITSQGRFLERLGIEARALALSRTADETQKQKIASDLKRLISADEMGTLFKAFSFHTQKLERPAGFPE